MSPFGLHHTTKLLMLMCCVGDAAPIGQRQPKRVRSSAGSSSESLLARAAELLHITTPPFVFNARADPGAKLALIDALWTGTWMAGVASRFADSNPAMRYLLELQQVDEDSGPTVFRPLVGQSRWEAVLAAIFRARTQHNVPIETAAMSISWLYYRVPKPIWSSMMYFGRAVMSRSWTEELCDAAVERDPGPNYPTAEGISAAVFDNLMMNVGYKSYATGGQAGVKIEMTNWATVFLPRAAMPTAYAGIDALLGAGGIFRTDVSMETFIDAFSPIALDIVQNQRARWASFLDKRLQPAAFGTPTRTIRPTHQLSSSTTRQSSTGCRAPTRT